MEETRALEGTTRERLKAAAIRLMARGGPRAVSVRSIAREAGVTEAVLYRHFEHKDALLTEVHSGIIKEMIGQKETMLASGASGAEKLRDWVHLTYESFDRDPSAFTFVLLSDHRTTSDGAGLDSRQSALFQQLVRDCQASGEFLHLDPVLATSLFVGILLAAPNLIERGQLSPPAAQYVDVVTDAARRLLVKPR